MTTLRPHLIISEANAVSPILIIDKTGTIGQALSEKLKDQFAITSVSSIEPKQHQNITHINFGKKIPVIPDKNYETIIVIYHGEKTTLDILPSIAKKAIELNSKLVFITAIGIMDKKLSKFLSQNIFDHAPRIIHGEIIDHENFEPNLLAGYINQARRYRKLDIPGNGLQKIYPVLFEEVCEAIITIAFSRPKNANSILVLPKHGFTELAVARAFQKIDPEIKINFTKAKHKDTEYDLPQGAEYYFQNYNLEEKLKKIDLTLTLVKSHVAPKKNRLPKINKPANKYKVLLLLLLFILIPVILELLLLLGGGIFLSESVKEVLRGNTLSAQKYNFAAKTSFASSLFIGQNMSGLNPIVFLQKSLPVGWREPTTQNAQVGLTLAEMEGDFLESSFKIKDIIDEKSLDPKADFMSVIASTKNNLITLQKLKAEGSLPEIILKKITPLDHAISLLGNTIDAYPDLLGFNQVKRYLILFQNNMELRPGGGFIGSYALIEIRNGKTGKLEIYDIYDADGKLSTHIEPPFALRRYLGASHLFMRDSNFDVDFISNAQSAKTFLDLETGVKVDGIIAIDTDFVKSLIDTFGPLEIHDFNETVNGENFFMLTETHAEKDFFPGSTQKKDFLRGVYNALESKFHDNKKIPIDILAQKISTAITQKHLMLSFPDSETQTVFTINNMSSSIVDNREKMDNKFLDFLGINEANLGMNKSNYYLKRSIEQKVTLTEDGSASESVNLTYQNTSTKDSVFGGDYKNFLRFILPNNSRLDSIEVNDVEIPTTPAIIDAAIYTKKGFVPPSQLEVEKTQKNNKAVFGFLVIIPSGTSQKITINYSIPKVINPAKPSFEYDGILFKQPGTQNDPYSFSLNYPNTFKPIENPSSFSDVGGKLLFSDRLSEDKNLILKFSKK